MQRRTFLASLGAVAASGAMSRILPATGEEQPSVEAITKPSKWPDEVFRRFSVDIHVPDWDPALLSRFDGAEFVETLAQGGVQSHLQYTNSHVGLCLWKTNVGKRHAAMKDRDFLGEVVAECHKRGIHPLAYFSLMHDNWAFEFHEDWRFHYADGSVPAGRYGLVCFNSPYRDYLLVSPCVLYNIGHIGYPKCSRWRNANNSASRIETSCGVPSATSTGSTPAL